MQTCEKCLFANTHASHYADFNNVECALQGDLRGYWDFQLDRVISSHHGNT